MQEKLIIYFCGVCGHRFEAGISGGRRHTCPKCGSQKTYHPDELDGPRSEEWADPSR